MTTSSPASHAPPLRLLLVATLRWSIAARLAIALVQFGCHVEVLAPRQHPAALVPGVRGLHRLSRWSPLSDLRAAMLASACDAVMPCDDLAALHLQQLHARAEATGDAPGAAGDATGAAGAATDAATVAADKVLAALIVRSLGSPAACRLATRRGPLMALAADLGVQVPRTGALDSLVDLDDWIARHPLPVVLKVDGTFGGLGVRIAESPAAARAAFARLRRGPTMRQALMRTLLDRDPAPLLRWLGAEAPQVSAQAFVAGTPANRAVACWQGQVLAGTSVQALRTQGVTGPATVVRVIDQPQMAAVAQQLVAHLGLSGLWGFDFMLESGSGAAVLIEVNPRATPICHLPLGPGHDLVAAWLAPWRAPRCDSLPALREPIPCDTVALFPGELQRDAASTFLRTAWHDVPWATPALVRDGLDPPWAERGWLARLAAARRRARPSQAGEADLTCEPIDAVGSPHRVSS